MAIKETLRQIAELARYYEIDQPYIVGGLPRDIYLQKEVKTGDVDLTTNSPDVLRLGVLVAEKLNVPFELSDDGHITVFADEFDIDFSSHFISNAVTDYLKGDFAGFEEAFSRDFTINALHQDLETGEFFDPTGMAVDDIKNKIIRTPVPVEITLTDDPRRAYRAINLSVRYNFSIDPEIVTFVKENRDLFSSENIKDKYITLKINKALNQDPGKTIELLQALELFEHVPLTGQFKDMLIERKMLIDYLGEGTMDKKSQTATSWQSYTAQGPEYKEIETFWRNHYRDFKGYESPSYNSWTKWYMDRYRGEWGNRHKSPSQTLRLMQEEVSVSPNYLNKDIKEKTLDFVKEIPGISYFFGMGGEDLDGPVDSGSGVDIVNVSNAVKSFIKVLGGTAKKMGAETPYITSGYRSVEAQARIMFKNWSSNGGMTNGRAYLVRIYGKTYGNEVADVFEGYAGNPASAAAIIPIIHRRGSHHLTKPARAIDLRVTHGIKSVLDEVYSSGRFNMKILDETDTAGPHYHITIYEDLGGASKIANINDRKEFLSKLAANNDNKNKD